MASLRRGLWGTVTALLAAGTAAVGLTGVATVTAEPEEPVRLVLEEPLPYGITQERVDALTQDDPVLSWEPLSMRVTDDLLARPREEDAEYPADVQLSTRLERMPVDMTAPGYDPSTLPAERHNGVVLDPGLFPGEEDTSGSPVDRPSTQLTRAFELNRDMGHSAASVVATARTAGELTYAGLPREPLLWIGLTGAMGALTLGAGLLWARAVRAVSELRRRFRLARARIARVVLDLEALEVSLLAVPEDRRPASSGRDWDRLSRRALDLVRADESLEAALRRPGRRTAADVDRYADAADSLASDAAVLSGTAEVRGGFAGAGDVLDRIAAVLVEPAEQTLARLGETRRESRPGQPGTRPVDEAVRGLRDAVDRMLALLEEVRGATDEHTTAWVGRWISAEARIGQTSLELTRALDAGPDAEGRGELRRELLPDRGVAGTARLREGIGLPPTPAEASLLRVQEALFLARAAAGEPLSGLRAEAAAVRPGTRTAGLDPADPDGASTSAPTGSLAPASSAGLPDDGRFRLRPGARLAGALAAVALAAAAAAPLAARATAEPEWSLTGDEEVGQVTVDGADALPAPRGDLAGPSEFTAEEVRDRVDPQLVESFDVVVAVRRAGDYLTRDPEDTGSDYSRRVTLESALEGNTQLIEEFPDLRDEATGELREDAVIIPLMVWPDGRGGVMPALTGHVYEGTESWLGTYSFERTSAPLWDAEDPSLMATSVAHEIEDVARGIQSNRTYEADLGFVPLWAVLAGSGAVMLLALGGILEALAGATLGLRGHGRTGRALRAARRSLGKLMLGRDERDLNAVAILGAGPAGSAQEAGQRLYESALVTAWREAEALGSLPFGVQCRADTMHRAEALRDRVEDLARQDEDVRRRAERFLRDSR